MPKNITKPLSALMMCNQSPKMLNQGNKTPPDVIKHTVSAAMPGDRVDRLIAMHLSHVSRTRLKALIIKGYLTLDGHTIKDPSYRVKQGQNFCIKIPQPEVAEPKPQKLPLEIVFEDEHLVVINKPAGMVVHPAPGNSDGTLVNALLAHCGESLSGIGGVKRPGIVHRLDKETSGLIVAAKNDVTHISLSEQFSARSIQRSYVALVWGVPQTMKGCLKNNIGRSHKNRKRMAVRKTGGKIAITNYKVELTFGIKASLLECHLKTGRTHQIRVHMSHIGHPIIGDPIYGGGMRRARQINLNEKILTKIKSLNGQALHAKTLAFKHPVHRNTLNFDSRIPGELVELMDILAKI